MKIGELFVELGVKGTGVTLGAFKSVKNNLLAVRNMSFEAKAAIVAAVYGLERMMSQSAQAGMSLTNFTKLTGLSSQSLQEWTYAAQQAGVSSETFTSELKNVQQTMAGIVYEGGMPKGLQLLANQVGFDTSKMKDTFYVLGQYQKFAQISESKVPKDLQNMILRSLGISDNMIAAMRKNVFNPTNFSRAPKYSEGETKQLANVDRAWSNLGTKIKMAFGHFTSKHGMKLVGDISKITGEVVKLAEAFVMLGESINIFGMINDMVQFLSTYIGKLSKLLNIFSKDKKGPSSVLKEMVFPSINSDQIKKLQSLRNGVSGRMLSMPALPSSPAKDKNGSGVTINQNLNFQHEGKDYTKIKDSVSEGVEKAFRTNPAALGGI